MNITPVFIYSTTHSYDDDAAPRRNRMLSNADARR
jgi:hypothetical protein